MAAAPITSAARSIKNAMRQSISRLNIYDSGVHSAASTVPVIAVGIASSATALVFTAMHTATKPMPDITSTIAAIINDRTGMIFFMTVVYHKTPPMSSVIARNLDLIRPRSGQVAALGGPMRKYNLILQSHEQLKIGRPSSVGSYVAATFPHGEGRIKI